MRRPALAALASAAALALTTIALAPSAGAAPSPHGQAHRNVHVCDTAVAGSAACDAIRHDAVDANGKVTPNAATPSGLVPVDIRSAYALTTDSTGTVAIVDAYDDPNAEADLGVYRAQFGLPACTTANGCFHKVSQSGTGKLPRANGGWAQEISLDLDMVSATCPGCHILLVEASSASFSNLGAGVNYAASVPGVVAISNSYGGSDSTATSAYKHDGIAITASTGDSGYGAQSPATFPGVVAVGGTSLSRASNTRGWTESAWSGAGSGCSTINDTTVQDKTATLCPKKAAADVSAVADPNTGVAVYDSYSYQGASGWLVFGGTSASSPIIASVFALAGNVVGNAGTLPWSHASSLNDVTTGSNGTCSTAKWCTAGAGWDGPTGLGTPNGLGAF